MFLGYNFLKNGHHYPPEELENVENTIAFIFRTRNIFYRVLVTDKADSSVIEVKEGEVVFPPEIARVVSEIDSLYEPDEIMPALIRLKFLISSEQ